MNAKIAGPGPDSRKSFPLFEVAIVFLSVVVSLGFLASVLVVLALPVHTFQHGSGVVQFSREMRLTSGLEGLVRDIYKSDFDSVQAGEAILAYSNDDKQDESILISDRIERIRKQLGTLHELQEIAAIRSELVEEKELELKSLQREKAFLSRRYLMAPRSGRVYFSTSPSQLMGSYLQKGSPLGNLYWGDEKLLRIEFPSDFVDRFKPGKRIIAFYRDPESLVIQRFWCEITQISIDKPANIIVLYAAEANGHTLMNMKPGTKLQCSVLMSSKSLLVDLLGPGINQSLPLSILSVLEWVQKELPASLMEISNVSPDSIPSIPE